MSDIPHDPTGEAIATVYRKGFGPGNVSWTKRGIEADLPDGAMLYAVSQDATGEPVSAPEKRFDAAELILRDVCETDPADPDLPDTICVSTETLQEIVERHTCAASLLDWAVGRWNAEVALRPLVNVHRRALDDTWRQIVRHLGGDPVSLLGPNHSDLLDAAPAIPVVDAAPTGVHPVAEQCARFVELYRREHAHSHETEEACTTIAEALRDHAGLTKTKAVAANGVAIPAVEPMSGRWKVRERRSPAGELVDCFVEAPAERDMAYWLEVLGDDYAGYGGVERKLKHCQLIVARVNAAPDAQRTDAEGLSDEQIFALLSEIADEKIIARNAPSIIEVGRRLLAARPAKAKPVLSDAQVDELIEPILRASGSSLRYYSMQKPREEMRAAMRAALEKFRS